MKSADEMTFEELKRLPNGPTKKFYLIKKFRAEILAESKVTDPRIFGCEALVLMITRHRAKNREAE